jgi:hypothetical protein
MTWHINCRVQLILRKMIGVPVEWKTVFMCYSCRYCGLFHELPESGLYGAEWLDDRLI